MGRHYCTKRLQSKYSARSKCGQPHHAEPFPTQHPGGRPPLGWRNVKYQYLRMLSGVILQWWAFWCTATIISSSAVHYPDREVAVALLRHWSLTQIGATTPPPLDPWQITAREFRENLEWAVVVPGDGEISALLHAGFLVQYITRSESGR
jgi:hypothetical protein